MRVIDTVVIHQTGTPQTAGNADTLAAIDRYHREVMGWRKIGYHRVIFRDGQILKGRLDVEVGAHVAGHNAMSVGICVVGAGNALPLTTGYMTDAAWRALVALCRIYQRAYGIALVRILGHREFPGVAKSCPGFDVAILRMALQVEQALGG